MNKKIIKYIIFTILCMIIIFMFSNQVSSDSNNLSKNIINSLINLFENIFNKNFDNEKIINYLNLPIRKLAHFTIFLTLSFCLINLFESIKVKHVFIFTIIICFIYASFDELHQMFIDERTSSVIDVITDMSGSIFAIFLKKVYNTMKQKGR